MNNEVDKSGTGVLVVRKGLQMPPYAERRCSLLALVSGSRQACAGRGFSSVAGEICSRASVAPFPTRCSYSSRCLRTTWPQR